MSKQAAVGDEWIAELVGPAQWTPDEARRVLAACERSGQSTSSFAARYGLKGQRIVWWRARLAANPSVTLVPAIIREVASVAARAPAVSVIIGAKVRVEVVDPASVSPAWCAALVDELARRLT